MEPCQKLLDAECFAAHPQWAKQAFAYRLLHLLTPKQLTRRLPKGLRLALLAPGVDLPPGLMLPEGTVVAPGTVLPSTWSPGDLVPPGILIVPGTVFPPDWTPVDPVPEGVIIEPGAEFPEGWTPPDPPPPGMIPAPSVPPGVEATGVTPPTYLDPGTPGPITQPGRAGALPEQITTVITSETADGHIAAAEQVWAKLLADPDFPSATTTGSQDSYSMTCKLAATYYTIYRAFLYFDLSSIPAASSIVSAIVTVTGYDLAQAKVSIQEGTQQDPLTTADWAAFTGDSFATISWQADEWPTYLTNAFELNSAGRTYLEGKIGDTAKFCLREYDYDYLAVAPAISTPQSGMYYADAAWEEPRPYITIIYT